jgi:hexosaminidase
MEQLFRRSCKRLVADAGAQTTIQSLEVSIGHAAPFPPQYGKMDESYNLTITASEPAGAKAVAKLVSNTQYGALRGLETFSQLFDQAGGALVSAGLPVTIEDWPYFEWRGIMLDVARHFFPIATIEGLVDAMASHKLNVLHLHLSDAQSFPVALASHPELAEAGAFSAAETYSTADLRRLVQYAAERGVRVVPELDMPAHAAGIGMSHPELIGYCKVCTVLVSYCAHWVLQGVYHTVLILCSLGTARCVSYCAHTVLIGYCKVCTR